MLHIARLNRIATAVLIAIVIALTVRLQEPSSSDSMITNGDFPGFFVLAAILKDGSKEDLYNLELQRSVQNKYWPMLHFRFNPSVYPPFVAIALKPLANFDRQTAQYIFTGLMVIFYCVSCWLLGKINYSFVGYRFSIGTISLLFFPLFGSIFGAQNTALSLLLLLSIIFLFTNPTPKKELIAGVLTALWFYKPQYGALFFFVTLLSSQSVYYFAGCLGTLGLLYMATYFYFEREWISWWLQYTSTFDKMNLQVNIKEAISLRGIITALGGSYEVGWLVTGGSFFLLCVVIIILRRKKLPLPYLLALSGAAIPLISPQTLFYDLPLALFSYLSIARFPSKRSAYSFLILIVYGAIAAVIRQTPIDAPFSLLAVILPILTFCELYRAKIIKDGS